MGRRQDWEDEIMRVHRALM